MSKFIIFKDNVILGYVNTHERAVKIIDDQIKQLSNQLRSNKSKILREDFDSGVRLFSQNLDTYLFPTLKLEYVLSYQELPELTSDVLEPQSDF
jgi:hypothetical protein